jgi:hypothetical protein
MVAFRICRAYTPQIRDATRQLAGPAITIDLESHGARMMPVITLK